jgi:hypothetical protein
MSAPISGIPNILKFTSSVRQTKEENEINIFACNQKILDLESSVVDLMIVY